MAVAAMERTTGRGDMAVAQECGNDEAPTKERPAVQVERGGPSTNMDMDKSKSTKLEGARRAWEAYASVGQSPRSSAVVRP